MSTPAVKRFLNDCKRTVRFTVIKESANDADTTVRITLDELEGIGCKIIVKFYFTGASRIAFPTLKFFKTGIECGILY